MKVYSFLLFFLLGTLTTQAQISKISGKVISVADGDTFTLLVDGKYKKTIRLYGIDCPENKQIFGNIAKNYTKSKVLGKVVTVQKMDTDPYRRTVAIVYLSEKEILNELLLRNGLAWHYKLYDKNKLWDKIEAKARLNKVGLWKQFNPTAPWSFRRRQIR